MLPTGIVEILLPLSFLVQIIVSSHASGTQLTCSSTTADMLQSDAEDHNVVVASGYVEKPSLQSSVHLVGLRIGRPCEPLNYLFCALWL